VTLRLPAVGESVAGRVQLYHRAVRRLFRASRIARPQKCLLAAALTLVGAYLSGAHITMWPWRILTASVVIGLVYAFCFVLNDYCDADADRVGKPSRPIPDGLISRSGALYLAALLAAAGVLLAAGIELRLALAALLLVGVSGAYSLLSLKTVPLLGIGTVALVSSATPVYGALAAAGLSRAVVALAACVFVNSFAMETLYTVHDVPADARAGTVTTALHLGPGPTLWLFQACNVLLILMLYVVPLGLGVASLQYLAAVSLLAVVPTALAAAFVGVDYDADRVARARLALRVIRPGAIIPMLLLHP
jgi:geranylgeranylglycerol-phosphate geranylgeranyltransferase